MNKTDANHTELQQDPYVQNLATTFGQMTEQADILDFLADLCTPAELKAMADRWQTAQLLAQTNLTQQEIAKQVPTSMMTVGRAKRMLSGEVGGFKRALQQLAL